jgi:beta-1,4-mannooligosaccharide phosphorylase
MISTVGSRAQAWRKLGRVYVPDGSKSWMRTHAANPIPDHLDGDRYRVYFSTRDERNRSSIAFVDIDLRDPPTILGEAEEPLLGPGDLAMFDDSGVSIGCVLTIGRKKYLYYMGWHLTVTVPWQNALGLAISDGPGAPFARVSRFPIVELNETDPYTISYPWVRSENGRFRMWYGSNIAWGARKEDMRHLIKYAESTDGVHWQRPGTIAIDFRDPSEYAMCKPCVVRDGDTYRMWFCSRGDRYRIRYAESTDGITWQRRDADVGLEVSPHGWDSEMIEYPCVFDHGGQRYMLYAGNGFGRTGFGIAVLEDDGH